MSHLIVSKVTPTSHLLNPIIPTEIEHFLFLRALDSADLVKFSAVNKFASELFTNDFFKELFAERNPYFAGNDKGKKYEHLESRFVEFRPLFPKNFWKIASCFFAKGTFNFDEPILKAVIKQRHEKAEEVKKELCDENPSSPIHQAREEHKKTKDLFNPINPNRILEGRESEYYQSVVRKDQEEPITYDGSFLEKINEKHKRMIAFDQRLVPQANHIRYQSLKQIRKSAEQRLSECDEALKDHTVFNRSLQSYFSSKMESQLLGIVARREALTEEDMTLFQSTFNVWAKAKHKGNRGSAMREIIDLISGYHKFEGECDSKVNKIKERLNPAECFIDSYADQPTESFAYNNLFLEAANEILRSLPKSSDATLDSIKVKMWIAVKERISRDHKELEKLPSNIQVLRFSVYNDTINSFARQPNILVFSNEEINSKAKELEKVFSYKHDDIVEAIKLKIINLNGKTILNPASS